MASPIPTTLGDFIQLKNRNALTHVIRTAHRLGIFKSLASHQKTVDVLSNDLGLQLAPLQQLMNVLVQTELIERYDDDYALSNVGHLIPEMFLDLGDVYWERLADHVRSSSTNGSPARSADSQFLQQSATEEWTRTPVALDTAEILDIGKSRSGLRILEIGGGSAIFSATLAHRDPESSITLLDTMPGIQRATETVASIGLQPRTEFITTDDIFHLVAVPELKGQTFDLVVVAAVLHRFGSRQCQTFLEQVNPWVKPAGELAIVDIFPGQKEGDTGRAIVELELSLRTTSGQLHDPAELKRELAAAGFRNIQFAHLPSPPHYWGLVVAGKS